ncbi:hypothetical protein PIB30_043187 [Stylosanthes scabra]|uniref:Uncharacterized protein n=1 Tax=Stylosanthes scabra TaxID=79078 RepID=A0ABU6VET3_9FABA|nr:hypothetical protein [Stylosanthes scabra]
MLDDRSFFEHADSVKPRPVEWIINDQPNGQQVEELNNCGVWTNQRSPQSKNVEIRRKAIAAWDMKVANAVAQVRSNRKMVWRGESTCGNISI